MVDVDHGAIYSSGFIHDESASRTRAIATKRSRLRLHVPTAEIASSARWLINGFPATILIWTAEEWARLTDRPQDAQHIPNGIWCALRIDEPDRRPNDAGSSVNRPETPAPASRAAGPDGPASFTV